MWHALRCRGRPLVGAMRRVGTSAGVWMGGRASVGPGEGEGLRRAGVEARRAANGGAWLLGDEWLLKMTVSGMGSVGATRGRLGCAGERGCDYGGMNVSELDRESRSQKAYRSG